MGLTYTRLKSERARRQMSSKVRIGVGHWRWKRQAFVGSPKLATQFSVIRSIDIIIDALKRGGQDTISIPKNKSKGRIMKFTERSCYAEDEPSITAIKAVEIQLLVQDQSSFSN